jgi:hypothetical protein
MFPEGDGEMVSDFWGVPEAGPPVEDLGVLVLGWVAVDVEHEVFNPVVDGLER